jgi:hypothetical protein
VSVAGEEGYAGGVGRGYAGGGEGFSRYVVSNLGIDESKGNESDKNGDGDGHRDVDGDGFKFL